MTDTLILPALAAITAAVSGLATAIGYLWRANANNHRGTQVKLEACEKRDEKSQSVMLVMTEKLGKLEGRQEGVEALARSVLREIGDRRHDTHN